MSVAVNNNKVNRISFGKIKEVAMPNLLDIQRNSYKRFVEKGLKEIAMDSSKITENSERWTFRITDVILKDDRDVDPMEIKRRIENCKIKKTSYTGKLFVKAQVIDSKKENEIAYSNDTDDGEEIFICDFPLMTPTGTFIINGAERTIVSQLVRSPGAYFEMSYDTYGKKLFAGRVNPNRGAWIEFESDSQDVLWVKIDKNKKIKLTTFVRSLAYFLDEKNRKDINETKGDFEIGSTAFADLRLTTDADILEFFDDYFAIQKTLEKKERASGNEKSSMEALLNVYGALRPGEPKTREGAKSYISGLFFDSHRYDLSRVGRYKLNKKLSMENRIVGLLLSEPVCDPSTGEILAEDGTIVTKALARRIDRAGVNCVKVYPEGSETPIKVFSNGMVDILPYLPEELEITKEDLEACGVNEKVMFVRLCDIRDNFEGQTKEVVLDIIRSYADKLVPRHIELDDLIASINYYVTLQRNVGSVDDIDHLGNRRVRCVGELIENRLRNGFSKLERTAKDKLVIETQKVTSAEKEKEEILNNPDAEIVASSSSKKKSEVTTITPRAVINANTIRSVVRDFFGSSQLSQFMDRNNPLSELTNKRRLSALGPGGLTADSATFRVRDVHYTHYGRMCPIETPEGQNIGLISYIATYARINEYGFIETPYKRIDKETGKILDEYVYMTADVEDEYYVVQGNEQIGEDGTFVRKRVNARHKDEFVEIDKSKADFMDVTPRMVVSVATSLIPFLANDDANRALMGANMMRQAVPLLKTEPPFVGTGMEHKAATDSGVCVISDVDGKVVYVDATTIRIQFNADGRDDIKEYNLTKYMRSNRDTCINQRPIVSVNDEVKAGDVIADGYAVNNGELSLGKNALVGFMTWEGYNYEDAVLINEKLVQNDVYTSIHIQIYECQARETKAGVEEITRDIPNVGDNAKKNLNEDGIIRIGAEVKSGDILVGRTTPKGEVEVSNEDKFLQAVFGEKSKETKDTSLRVPHGSYGIVIKTEVIENDNSDRTSEKVLRAGVTKIVRVYIAQKRKIQVGDKMAGRHGNKGVVSRVLARRDMPFLADGTPLDIVLNPLGVPSRMNIGQVLEVHLGFACRTLGLHIATPVFDGATEKDIREKLREAGLREDGKSILRDGRTGETFDRPVTVGVMYYLKLHHLVDDKMHARASGPYSLVTRQPLGGKARLGGQRFGEMEVWALEAYGAAYTLREIMTYKSDDVTGRDKAYQSILNGENLPDGGLPESFRVLTNELKALGFRVRAFDKDEKEIKITQDFFDKNKKPVEFVEFSNNNKISEPAKFDDDDDDDEGGWETEVDFEVDEFDDFDE